MNLSFLEEFFSKDELEEEISKTIKKMNCRKDLCICVYKNETEIDLQGFLVDSNIHSFLRGFDPFYDKEFLAVKDHVEEIVYDCLYLRIREYLKLRIIEIIKNTKKK
jgi:hypothetical protein